MVSIKFDIKRLLKSCWRLILVLFCFAAPFAVKADHILDYETGEFFEGKASDYNLLPTYTRSEDGESVTLEIDFRYAVVKESLYYEDCVTWFVPGSSWLRFNGKPQLNCINHYMRLPEGYNCAELTILETEYKDFDYELQPTIPPSFYGPPTLYIDIDPYEGIYPAQPALIHPQNLQRKGEIRFNTLPVAYDYEHKSVRAYTHLKLRIDYQKDDSRVEGANRILEYETGALFEGDASKQEYLPREVINSNGTSTTMEFDINYAVVEPSRYPFYGDCVTWRIPTYSSTNTGGEPEILHQNNFIDLPEGYSNVSVTILEEEYKDFNFALQPAIPFPPDSGPDLFVDITPYEGFTPTHPVKVNCQSFRGDYTAYVYFYPIMYDYEHKIVRAYSHIKFRLDYLEEASGIEEVGADDAPAEYFNLQGIKVDKPEHGVYIERKGGKAAKVVF